MSAKTTEDLRVSIPNSPTLDDLSLEKTTGVTVNLPKTILIEVDGYQTAFRKRFGRKLSRENAILRILLLSSYSVDEQLRRWEEDLVEASIRDAE